MQQISIQEKRSSSPDQDLYSEAQMSQDFAKLSRISEDDDVKSEEYYPALDNLNDEEQEEEEEEEEFSFVCGVENESAIAAEDAFADGQIKAVFPLFNRRDLLSHGGDSNSLHQNLPSRPPVKNVFVQTVDDQVTSPEEIVGPYCEWSSKKVVEVCKKSNSTGFSKIWRLKEFVGRSSSDGKDAFVFLNNAKTEDKVEKTDQSTVKKVKKTKTASLSAHEVYLRSKAKEDDRRRSYLPYRPELVGFFTNVNGGLTKNVHPY